MIHDAQVEVTCDGDGCIEHIFVPLDYTPYHGYGNKDSEIEAHIGGDGWITKDGKHYCCEDHAS